MRLTRVDGGGREVGERREIVEMVPRGGGTSRMMNAFSEPSFLWFTDFVT